MTTLTEQIPDFLTLTTAPNERLHRCWQSLVGVDDVKEQLLNHMILCLDFQVLSSWYDRFCNLKNYNPELTLSLKSKTLLIGPSGTGKTTLARGSADALSKKLDEEVYLVEMGFTRSRYLGESSKNIIKAFNQVREWADKRPVVFFLDELDTVASTRAFEQQHEDVRASVNNLIKELDKISPSDCTYVLAASNLESHIDIAVKRRFDQIISFERPSFEQRLSLFRRSLSPFSKELHDNGYCIDDKEILQLARKTQDYTQADIKNLVTNAIAKAVFEDRPLTQEHLLSVLEIMKPTNDYQ